MRVDRFPFPGLCRRLQSRCNDKFFPVPAAQNTRNMTSAILDSSKKNFVAQKCCLCAARRIAVMIPNRKKSSLAAKD